MVATAAAARNEMNMGFPFGVGGGAKKSVLVWVDEGACGGLAKQCRDG